MTAFTSRDAFQGSFTRAGFMKIDNIRNSDANAPSKIPSVDDFAVHLRRNDLKPEDEIIFYDDFSIVGAARAHFLFHHFGIDSSIGNFTNETLSKQKFQFEEGTPTFKAQVS